MSDQTEVEESWRKLLADVLIQREGDLERAMNTPLDFGEYVAWVTKRMGLTDGVSEVHRVGYPQHGYAYTACGELISGPYYRFPLSPALVRTLENCTYCNAEIGRVARKEAA